eukprot:3952868-Alexandrium_andersonii.AAC.1
MDLQVHPWGITNGGGVSAPKPSATLFSHDPRSGQYGLRIDGRQTPQSFTPLSKARRWALLSGLSGLRGRLPTRRGLTKRPKCAYRLSRFRRSGLRGPPAGLLSALRAERAQRAPLSGLISISGEHEAAAQ